MAGGRLGPLVVLILGKAIRVLTILVVAWLMIRVLKVLTGRVQRHFEDRDPTAVSEVEQRAVTAVHLLNSMGAAIIGIAATLTVLNLFIPIGPLLAGVGAGVYSTCAGAAKSTIKKATETAPRTANADLYEYSYAIYRSLYPSNKTHFQDLSNIAEAGEGA